LAKSTELYLLASELCETQDKGFKSVEILQRLAAIHFKAQKFVEGIEYIKPQIKHHEKKGPDSMPFVFKAILAIVGVYCKVDIVEAQKQFEKYQQYWLILCFI
jgi:hypothetical protein